MTSEAASKPTSAAADEQRRRLFHPSLAHIPMALRFVLSGVTGNVFFMAFYNYSYAAFQSVASASRIFAVVQFLCIVVNHFLNVGIVFGWPDNYLASLSSNMPVGLASLALGAFTMDRLEQADFDGRINSWSGEKSADVQDEEEEKKGGFYASIVVMIVTGVFNYVALNIVNAPSKDKKAKEKEL
mmetsp:Transcript_7865/g.17128  ORF Transcript_7865/g.17128 Transcript_7865/m.17128 type:complete len:185 (+) Transcript_7865:83-637(+)